MSDLLTPEEALTVAAPTRTVALWRSRSWFVIVSTNRAGHDGPLAARWQPAF